MNKKLKTVQIVVIILAIVFAILTIVLGILYLA